MKENTPEPSSAVTESTDSAARKASYTIRPLTLADIKSWLHQGWQDFRRAPWQGAAYGVAFCLMGHAIWWLLPSSPAFALSLSAGFLLTGPFFCLGLYDISRQLASGQPVNFLRTLTAWPALSQIAPYAFVLLVLELLWSRASLVVIAVYYPGSLSSGDLISILTKTDSLQFLLTYFLVGGFFSTIIYVSSVISIPMLVDRPIDGITAALSSMRVCLENPVPMMAWGGLIAIVVFLAMLPYFIGLIVVTPVIGFASWHAYRHIIIVDGPD